MANDKMNPNSVLGTSERDQSKQASQPKNSASTGGHEGEKGGFSKEKSTIGGEGQGQGQDHGKTGEAGRTRSELDKKSPSDTTVR